MATIDFGSDADQGKAYTDPNGFVWMHDPLTAYWGYFADFGWVRVAYNLPDCYGPFIELSAKPTAVLRQWMTDYRKVV